MNLNWDSLIDVPLINVNVEMNVEQLTPATCTRLHPIIPSCECSDQRNKWAFLRSFRQALHFVEIIKAF